MIPSITTVTANTRISRIRPLIPPAILLEELPCPRHVSKFVEQSRKTVEQIIQGSDDRLLVIVGPCSIHDVGGAREYAQRLRALAELLSEDIFMVMRVYFEKPRTTVGWKGLINDPHLDGTFDINTGLRLSRQLLLDINTMGVPVGCELLDTISPQFIADVVTWGAIGARTTESQLHRELVSGLSFPVGFKNGTTGDVKLAVNGMISSAHPHSFLGVTEQGLAAIVQTKGNMQSHVILRGGTGGPNYKAKYVTSAIQVMQKTQCNNQSIMIDCSHGNSKKDHKRQPIVAEDVANQIAGNDKDLIDNSKIMGVMIESNLVEGNQKLIVGKSHELIYGISITDKCIGWATTIEVLKTLASAVQLRRSKQKTNKKKSNL